MNGDNGVYVDGDHSDHSTSSESPKAKVPRVEARFPEHHDTTPPFRPGAPPMCRLGYNRPPLRGPRGIPVNGAPRYANFSIIFNKHSHMPRPPMVTPFRGQRGPFMRPTRPFDGPPGGYGRPPSRFPPRFQGSYNQPGTFYNGGGRNTDFRMPPPGVRPNWNENNTPPRWLDGCQPPPPIRPPFHGPGGDCGPPPNMNWRPQNGSARPAPDPSSNESGIPSASKPPIPPENAQMSEPNTNGPLPGGPPDNPPYLPPVGPPPPPPQGFAAPGIRMPPPPVLPPNLMPSPNLPPPPFAMPPNFVPNSSSAGVRNPPPSSAMSSSGGFVSNNPVNNPPFNQSVPPPFPPLPCPSSQSTPGGARVPTFTPASNSSTPLPPVLSYPQVSIASSSAAPPATAAIATSSNQPNLTATIQSPYPTGAPFYAPPGLYQPNMFPLGVPPPLLTPGFPQAAQQLPFQPPAFMRPPPADFYAMPPAPGLLTVPKLMPQPGATPLALPPGLNPVPNFLPTRTISQGVVTPGAGLLSIATSKAEEIWVESAASGGRVYYYNMQTRETRWDRPEGVTVLRQGKMDGEQAADKKAKPTDSSLLGGSSQTVSSTPVQKPPEVAAWKEYQSTDGKPYYHNAQTGETTWEKPKVIAEWESKNL